MRGREGNNATNRGSEVYFICACGEEAGAMRRILHVVGECESLFFPIERRGVELAQGDTGKAGRARTQNGQPRRALAVRARHVSLRLVLSAASAVVDENPDQVG